MRCALGNLAQHTIQGQTQPTRNNSTSQRRDARGPGQSIPHTHSLSQASWLGWRIKSKPISNGFQQMTGQPRGRAGSSKGQVPTTAFSRRWSPLLNAQFSRVAAHPRAARSRPPVQRPDGSGPRPPSESSHWGRRSGEADYWGAGPPANPVVSGPEHSTGQSIRRNYSGPHQPGKANKSRAGPPANMAAATSEQPAGWAEKLNQSISLSFSLSLSLSIFHSFSIFRSPSFDLSLTHSHTHTLSFSLSLYLSLFLHISLFLFRSRTHSLTHTLSPFLDSPSPVQPQSYSAVQVHTASR